MAIKIALNTPMTADGLTTEVTQSRDSKRYSVIVTGGDAAERREAAEYLFFFLGREMGEGYGITRPYGEGMIWGEAVTR